MDRKPGNKLKYILVAVILLLAGASVSLRLGHGHFFEIVAVKGGEVITFTTTFKHSVQQSDWTDFFEITKDWTFRLYETRFSDFGWGLPSQPDAGAKMEVTDEYIRYYDMNRVMNNFKVAVTTANDRHFMMMDGFLVDLVKKAGPGRLLEFKIR
jgi:hypothetical protein